MITKNRYFASLLAGLCLIAVQVAAQGTTGPELFDGVTVFGSFTGENQTSMYHIEVTNSPAMMRTMLNSDVDFDLYGKLGSEPTKDDYDWRGYTTGDEDVEYANPGNGTWYIMVDGYDGAGDYDLTCYLWDDLSIPVPDVVGESESAARSAITSAGLDVGNVTTANSDTVATGDVVSQNPTSGVQVDPGTSVDLVVSDGPALFEPFRWTHDFANVTTYIMDFADLDSTLDATNLDSIHDEVTAFYDICSNGKFSLNFAVYPHRLRLPGTYDDYMDSDTGFHTFVADFRAALMNIGVDAKYPEVAELIIIAPPKFRYSSAASYPLAKIYDEDYDYDCIRHELGHSLGMRHAQALEAGDDIVGVQDFDGSVTGIEEHHNYGNVYDVMGEGDSKEHFNVMLKNHMRWLEPHEFNEITTSGTYRLYTHDQDTRSGNTIALKLIGGNTENLVGDGPFIYWVEFRTSDFHSPAPNSKNGVQVNIENYFPNVPGHPEFRDDYTDRISYLLDMTPNSQSDDTWHANDAKDSELLVGESFSDKYGAFTITPIAVSSDVDTNPNAWIDVEVVIHDGFTENPNGAVYVSLSGVPATMVIGETATVNLTMRNTGTETWTTDGYKLGTANPRDNTNWTGANRVDLPHDVLPGATVNIPIHITAPSVPETYDFQWQMIDHVEPHLAWFGALSENREIVVTSGATDPALTVWSPSTSAFWTDAANWSGGVAPMNESQNLKVVFNVAGAQECLLSTGAQVAQLVVGDNGDFDRNFLRLLSGGHLVCGVQPGGGTEWTAFGYNRPATVTVMAGATIEAKANLLIGFDGSGDSALFITGGNVDVSTVIELGTPANTTRGLIRVKEGGRLSCGGLMFRGSSSEVDVHEGTVVLDGDKTAEVQSYISNGTLIAYDGTGTLNYDYNSSIPGKTTITAVQANIVRNPSFEAGGATPDEWSTPGAYSRSAEQYIDGGFSLKGTGSGAIGTVSQVIGLERNTDYNISFRLMFHSGESGPVVFDTNDDFDPDSRPGSPGGNGQVVISSATGNWETYTGSFNSAHLTQVTIRIFTEGSFDGTFYVDNVVLTKRGSGTAPTEGYEAWAATVAGGVDFGDASDDFDGDGRNNFYEYALNGNPNSVVDNGVNPIPIEAGDDRVPTGTATSVAGQSQRKTATRPVAKTIPPLPKMLQNADLLQEKSRVISKGRVLQKSLYRTSGKYPVVLVQETYKISSAGEQEFVSREVMVGDHLLIRFPEKMSESEINRWTRSYGYSVLEKLSMSGVYIIQTPEKTLSGLEQMFSDFYESFSEEKGIGADYDGLDTASVLPNDPDSSKL